MNARDSGEGGPGKDRPNTTNAAAARHQLRGKRTTNVRQRATATHVVVEAVEVIGATGRHRWIPLVRRCPGCGASHVSHARGELPVVLQRAAACGRGRLALHPVGTEATG